MTTDPTGPSPRLLNLRTDCIHADQHRFQARDPSQEDASGGDLSDVKAFNADFAGVIRVWMDPSDGRTYVVDGHRRLNLAHRTGTPQVLAQYLSCRTAGDAFGNGILINISQWVFDSEAKLLQACACRRQALENALTERRLDPASEVAQELFEHFPDLKARYASHG